MAGWLFAELAMAMVIIGFGTQFNPLAAAPAEPPPATSTTEPERPGESGLSLRPLEFVIGVPPESRTLSPAFAANLRREGVKDGDVGLILLFGVSRDGNPLNGTRVSEQLADQIKRANLPQLSSDVVIRTFLGDSADGNPSDVKVELYVFTGER